MEGFFVKTTEGLIFTVKGVLQPEGRTICSLRYVPSANGGRGDYKKVLPRDGYLFLNENNSEYVVFDETLGRGVQSVPRERVDCIFDPVSRLRSLRNGDVSDPLAASSVALASGVKKAASIPWRNIGITGSILLGLHSAESDIDLVIFGEKSGRKVYRAMPEVSGAGPHTRDSISYLYGIRGKPAGLSFEEFAETETRKRLQGTFRGRDFQLRLVKRPDETGTRFGDFTYEQLGRVEAEATVSDASEAIFTPCTYRVDDVHIAAGSAESLDCARSFMGRFCEGAIDSERIRIIGGAERKSDGTIGIVLGDRPGDRLTVL